MVECALLSPRTTDNYTYAETNYANPHAPTGYFNGSATTTFAYDAIGNLATTTGAATTTASASLIKDTRAAVNPCFL